MNVVDVALFELLESAGMWVPALHEDDDAAVAPEDALIVHDGELGIDNEGNEVVYALPYAVFHSSLGDEPESDENSRLTGNRGRMSVFFTVMYVGLDRWQAKHAGQQVREAISGRRPSVSGHRVWKVQVEESQRVRRDDDIVRPGGERLFYGVDNYAVSITIAPKVSTP